LTASAGSAKAKDPASEARATLREVAQEAHQIRANTGEMEMLDRGSSRLSASYVADFEVVKEDVNRAGKQFRALEAERASLEPWEQHALDRVEPLFASIAQSETKAIEFYNEHRPNLTDPAFKGYLEQIDKDSHRAAQILDEYFKLAKARQVESRLSSALEGQGN